MWLLSTYSATSVAQKQNVNNEVKIFKYML